MSILPVLLLLSLGFAALAVLVFLLAVGRGQFDDLDTPPHRILWEDTPATTTPDRKEESFHEDPA